MEHSHGHRLSISTGSQMHPFLSRKGAPGPPTWPRHRTSMGIWTEPMCACAAQQFTRVFINVRIYIYTYVKSYAYIYILVFMYVYVNSLRTCIYISSKIKEEEFGQKLCRKSVHSSCISPKTQIGCFFRHLKRKPSGMYWTMALQVHQGNLNEIPSFVEPMFASKKPRVFTKRSRVSPHLICRWHIAYPQFLWKSTWFPHSPCEFLPPVTHQKKRHFSRPPRGSNHWHVALWTPTLHLSADRDVFPPFSRLVISSAISF